MSLKIRAALLPQKHISFGGSILGIAGRIRALLKLGPLSLEEIQVALDTDDVKNNQTSVEHILVSVLLLYAISQVETDDHGRIGLTL